MTSARQFQQELNQSDATRHMAWEAYRTKVSEAILQQSLGTSRVWILGAGNMDDLDLSMFSEHFDQVFLSDIDPQAMSMAVIRDEVSKEKVKMVPLDVTGLEHDPDFEFLLGRIRDSKSLDDIQKLFQKWRHIVEQFEFPSALFKSYDMIVVSPIFTQLFFPQIKATIDFLRSQHVDETKLRVLQREALAFMPELLDQVLLKIRQRLSPKTVLVILSDVFEAQRNSMFYQQASSILSNTSRMDEYYDDYLAQYGIGLGDYVFHRLEETNAPFHHQWFDWPFDLNKHLIVKLACYQMTR